MSTEDLERRAWTALEDIFDPCSVATRSPLSIVELGLVRRLSVEEPDRIELEISPTAASCILIASIAEAAEKAICALDGVREVNVTIDSEFFWTPDAMTERGSSLLAQHRARRAGRLPKPLGRVRGAPAKDGGVAEAAGA